MEFEAGHYMAMAMFLSFIVLIFMGYPVAWLMGGLAMIFTVVSVVSDTYLDTFFGVDWGYTSILVTRIYAVMSNWVLVALPMFVFMGIMLDRSGIAEDLMSDLTKLFGRVRGGLAVTVVFIGILLAASTGIIGAAVVLLAILGVPLMLKHRYDPRLACGVVCATGTLGILIPPSIMLVMMGDQIRISVGDLFMGAVFPGLLLGALYTIYIFGLSWVSPGSAPAPEDAEPVSWYIVKNVLRSAIPPAALTQLRRFRGRTSGKSMTWRFFRHYSPASVSLQVVFGDMIFVSTPSSRYHSRCSDSGVEALRMRIVAPDSVGSTIVTMA